MKMKTEKENEETEGVVLEDYIFLKKEVKDVGSSGINYENKIITCVCDKVGSNTLTLGKHFQAREDTRRMPRKI